MGIKDYVCRKVDNTCAAASAVAGGLALGQFPQFLAQYVQRLGGHIDEARDASAMFSVPELAQRANHLTDGLNSINNAGTLEKLVAFVQNAEWEIARRAWDNFTPGMTFDTEGLLYCGVGVLGALAVYELGYGAAKGIGSLIASKKK